MNYIYGLNEPIHVIDIDTRDELGTLTITGVEVLKDEKFTAKERDGYDANSQPKYKDVTYEQIVQVFYDYDFKRSKAVTDYNFGVLDASGIVAVKADQIDPLSDYTEKTKKGSLSFVVALKNRSDSIQIQFRYNSMQVKPTAKIKIDL